MKTSLFSLLLIGCIGLQAQSKLKFEKVNNMSSPMAGFSVTQNDRDIYAIGGSSWTQWVSSDLLIYDTHAETWIEAPLKGIPRFNEGSALYLDNHECILLAGGIQPYGSSLLLVDSIRAIYPETFKVRTLGPTPAPAKRLGLAYHDEKVYMFGGSTNVRRNDQGTRFYKFSKKLYAYDLFSGVVQELPDMPNGMETEGGIIDGNLYLIGGFDGTARSTVWKYDIEAREWAELPRLPKPISSHRLLQYKHYFIALGDYSHSDQLMVYNTKTQQARYFKTNLQIRRGGASIMGNELFVFGGRNMNLGMVEQASYKISLDKIIAKKGSIQ